MARVKLDNIKNSGRLTRDGWELERLATVYELTGDAHKRLVDAAEAVDSVTGVAVPSIDDAHPSVDDLYLDEISPLSVAPKVVKLRLSYRQRPGVDDESRVLISMSTATRDVETNLDRDGNMMNVTYTEGATQTTYHQGVIVSVQRSSRVLVITRTGSIFPMMDADDYADHVNSRPWDVVIGSKAGEWLCRQINSESDNNGISYEEQFLFERGIAVLNKEGKVTGYSWGAEAIYIDPSTGRPPHDVSVTNGMRSHRGTALGASYAAFEVYPETDFNALRLTPTIG